MKHLPGCPATRHDDDGLYYLGDIDTARDDWREYAEDLFDVREELGCSVARFIADHSAGSRDEVERHRELYDTDRDAFLMLAALSTPED